MGETGPDPLKDLEKALEQWGRREPKTPPETGARRVLDRLPESREKSRFSGSSSSGSREPEVSCRVMVQHFTAKSGNAFNAGPCGY